MALILSDVAVVPAVAVVGLLLGPMLAALTHRASTDAPMSIRGLLRGVPAPTRRITWISAVSAAVFAVLAAVIGAEAALPAFLLMGAAGLVLAVIDTEHHRLPDRVVLPTYVLGATLLLLAATLTGDFTAWLRSLFAAAVVFAVFFGLALISPEGFGFGDVKLGGLLGMFLGWLGWGYVVLGVVAGFLLGAVVSVLLIALRRASLRTPVPFGPALLAGAMAAVVAGPELLLT